MGRKAVDLAPEILAAQQRLSHWRSNNPKGRWVPEEFWVLAAELAKKHGVAKTARQLKLNTGKLKRYLVPKNDNLADKEQSDFVEVIRIEESERRFRNNIEIECINQSGCRLNINTTQKVDPAELMLAFFRR